MNELQRATYVLSQVACMLAELEAMKAENHRRRDQGLADAFRRR